MIGYRELAKLSAAEMALRIRRRHLSPVELVDSVIAAIEERNPSLNAMVVFGFEAARASAKAAECAVMAGEALGLLHGVPVAMKDCFDFKPGWVNTFGGVPALKGYVAASYCNFAERMERAGAVIIGKTNSPALGFRGTCDNYLFGPTRNPFNLAKNSGGSSGGSGAIVADGLVPLAEGTDGGGSIRIPAAWCGVYGYKASFGRVPNVTRPNAFATTSPYIYEGPITRTVEDAALAMEVIGGYDARDPNSLDDRVGYMDSLRRGVRGKKIAYTPDYGIFPIDPQIGRIAGEAVKVFADLGAHVEEVKIEIPYAQRELSDLWCRFSAHNALQAIAHFKTFGVDLTGAQSSDLPPELHHWLDIARHQSAQDWLNDHHMRTRVYDSIEAVMARYDLLAAPTLASLPVDNAGDRNTLGPCEINGEAVDPFIGWCCTYIQNYTGHPAATLPAGLAADNLPVGLQIAGRRFADADVIAASAAFERARPWLDIYEICAGRSLAWPKLPDASTTRTKGRNQAA